MKQSTFYYLLRRGVIGGGGSAAGPTNTLAPVISGTAERGETLTSTTGTWTGTGTISYAYQWKRSGADISGATSSTYVLVAADDNAFITCNVTATDDTGSRSKLSNSLGPVLAAPLSLTDPVASGTAQVGQTLSTTDGTWQGIATITFAYQWRRDAVNISGATSSTYTLVAADYSTDVDCVVTATNSLGSTSADSNDILNIAGTAPVISGVPTISSQTQVGETITATAASVSGVPTPTTSWQWQRSADGSTGWANISGATSSTYTLVLADDTNYVRAVQTETNAVGSDSANSAASAQISSTPAFDADYQAVLDRSTTLGYTAPSAGQQTLQNSFVTDLKAAGVWSKLDLFYVFATDGDSDYATLNWKAPSSFQLTKTNSPTFTQNEGFAQSGTAYLETGFILNTNGTNYTQDDAGVFVGFPTLSSTALSNNRPIGVEGVSNYLNIRIDADGTNANNRVWLNTTTSFGNLNYYKKDDSIYFANRTSSTAVDYRNTDLANDLTNSSSGSITSSSLPNRQLLLLGWGSGYFEQTANMGIFAMGSSLTATEMADIETAWFTNYFTSL